MAAPPGDSMGKKVGWSYLTKKELEDMCLQRADGISAERAEAKRLAYSALLQDTGEAMKMCVNDRKLGSCQHCSAACSDELPASMPSAQLDDVDHACNCSPILAVATATMLCHRFYTIQSMRSYDSWVRLS